MSPSKPVPRSRKAKFPGGILAFFKSDDFHLSVMEEQPPEDAPENWGQGVKIWVQNQAGVGLMLDLTQMRTEEVLLLKDFLEKAFDKALAVTLARDKIAQEGLENGDDSFIRIYRRIPEVVDRYERT